MIKNINILNSKDIHGEQGLVETGANYLGYRVVACFSITEHQHLHVWYLCHRLDQGLQVSIA